MLLMDGAAALLPVDVDVLVAFVARSSQSVKERERPT